MNVQATLVNMVAPVQISLTDLDVVVLLGLEDLHAEKVSEKLFNISFLPSFLYISQNYVMARFAVLERSKLHQILKTTSISPLRLTYAFVSFSLSLYFVFTDFKLLWLFRYFIKERSSSVYHSSFLCSSSY